MMIVSYIEAGSVELGTGSRRTSSYSVLRAPCSLLLDLFALDILHERHKISNSRVHARQIDVIIFRNLNAISLAKFHDDVEKVHAVQFKLLAELLFIIQLRQILIRRNITQDIQHFFSDFSGRHPDSSPIKNN